MQYLKIIAGTLALTCCLNAYAKEGGDQYPNGAEGFMAGALPPPGHYLLNYAGYYGGTMHDKDGNEVSDVEVTAWFDALRYVNVTEHKLLGADYAWHIIVPIVKQELNTPGGDKSVTGLGDITVSPLALGWHWSEWHMLAGVDFHLPFGKYSKSDPLARIGANYLSVEPFWGITYRNQSQWEASAKLMYNIKQENDYTHYQSGDEFHMDYTVGKHLGNWSLGLGGYYLVQLEEDEQDGVTLADTEAQVLAVGPQVAYNYKGMSFIFKWHHETQVENRFGGDKVFFKFVTRF